MKTVTADKRFSLKNVPGDELSVDNMGNLYIKGEDIQRVFSSDWLRISIQDKTHGDLDYRSFPCQSINTSEGEIALLYSMNGASINALWRAEESGFSLKIDIENHGISPISGVGVFLSEIDLESNAKFALPHGAGFIADANQIQDNELIKLHYPVFASMQWLDVFDGNHGIYIGVEDEKALSKLLIAGKSGNHLMLGIQYEDIMVTTGSSISLPLIQVLVHCGDWREGAKHYSSWFHKTFKKPSIPQWFAKMPVWAWALCKLQRSEKPNHTFDELKQHWNQFQKLGVEALQISGYMENGHDSHFPDYKAGQCVGGEAGLDSLADHLHKQGNYLSLYTNGRIADPDSSISSETDWQEWSVGFSTEEQMLDVEKRIRFHHKNNALTKQSWDESNTHYKETYGKVTFAVMCPFSKNWQSFYIQKLLYLARTHHIDGIYLDQVCGASGLVCYQTSHGHASPSEAWHGYTSLIAVLRKNLKQVNPEMYIATEGINDIIGINIDLFQAHNWGFRFGLPPCALPEPMIFLTCLPEYMLLLGPVMLNDYCELRRAYLYGRGIDIALENLSDCQPDFVKELLFVVQSRKRWGEEFINAELFYVHNKPEIKCCQLISIQGNILILGAWLDSRTDHSENIILTELFDMCDTHVVIETPFSKTLSLLFAEWLPRNS